MVLSAGCAKTCPAVRPIRPPIVYLQTIPEPQFKGKTNADLLAYILDLRQALRLANSDKQALQKWMVQYE